MEDTLHYVIRKAGRKNEELIPCAGLTLHTFGRPLNWIPHIHVLLAEGGVRKSGSFKPLNHIHYDSLRFSFQKQLLDRMENKLNSPDFKIVKSNVIEIIPMASMFTLHLLFTNPLKTVWIILFVMLAVLSWLKVGLKTMMLTLTLSGGTISTIKPMNV